MPVLLSDATTAFRSGTGSPQAVVDALRQVRLLVPLIAHLAETAEGAGGLTADKRAELSLVTVAGPDSRDVLPVFSSAASMARWNPNARPIPVEARRAALAAASEGTELVVLDPGSDTEFALRRRAIRAIAEDSPWHPAHTDPLVVQAFASSVEAEPAVTEIVLAPGDPSSRLRGPELLVRLTLVAGLDAISLRSLIDRVQSTWSSTRVIADVDGLALTLV